MPRNRVRSWLAGVLTVIVAVGGVVATPRIASAATPVDLGTAANFAVLGGQTVTNVLLGVTVVTGDLGTSPGAAVTGFPPGVVVGTIHPGDTVAAQAQADLTTAYNDAATQAPATVLTSPQLGNLTLPPGIYSNEAEFFNITGTLTLDAQGDPNAVFIFQMDSTLVTAAGSPAIPASRVRLINGAQACNVFWQVGSSATLGTYSVFAGNILALTSITATTGAIVDGRLLARNGAVTLDRNIVTRSTCGTVPPGTGTTVTAACISGRPDLVTLIARVRPGNLTGPVEFFADGVSLGTALLDSTGHAFLPVSGLSRGVRRIVAGYLGTPPSASGILSLRVGPYGPCPEIASKKWIIVERETEERDRPLQMQHQEQITEGVRSTSDQTDRADLNVKSRRHGCHRRCHS